MYHRTVVVFNLAYLRRQAARGVSSCVPLYARRGQAKGRAATELLPPEERLQYLKAGERRVAIFAGVSLIVGYIALKLTFKTMATKPLSTDSHEVSPIPPPRVRPLVIAGPSGSGKSTLLRKLFKEFPDTFGLSVSHTTRRPRAGEVNGKEYYFTTREEMKKSIEKGEFLEWTEFSGNMYGTSKQAIKDVLAANRVCVLDIDMVGVKNMKETDLNPVYVLIKPPSLEELEKRLRDRGSETEESLKRRLDTAKGELEFAQTPGVFNHVVVNGISVDEAYQQLKTIIHKDLVPTKDESSK